MSHSFAIRFVLFVLSFYPCTHYTLTAQSLELIKTVDSTSIRTGITFNYTLQFRCASITSDCEQVILQDTLPPALEFIDFTSSPLFSSSTSYDSDTRVLTFELNKQTGAGMQAGSTGEVRFRARVANGVTPNNFPIVNRALISSTNATDDVSNEVTTTATAASFWTINKYNQGSSEIHLDQDFGYFIYLDDINNGNAGSLNLDTATIVDKLPAGALFVQADNGGVYDAANHEVVWTLPHRNIGHDWSANVVVNYPSSQFSPNDEVNNIVEFYGQPVGEPYELQNTANQAGTIANPTPTGIINKYPDKNSAVIGDLIQYSIDARNQGSTLLENFTFTDVIPEEIELVTFRTGQYTQTATLDISYQTNLNSNFQTVAGSPFDGSSNMEIAVADLGLSAGEYITVVRYDYGDIAPGFQSTNIPKLDALVLATDRSGNPVTANQTITNCADLDYTYNNNTTSDQNCANVTVREPIASDVAMDKRADNSNIPIGGELNYILVPSLIGDVAMDSIVMVDTIPAQMNLERTESGGWNNISEDVEVYYQTNLNSNFSAWAGSPYAPNADAQLLIGDLSLTNNEYVTVVKWVFRQPQTGFANDGRRPRIRGTLMEIDRNGIAPVVGDNVTNCANLTGYLDGTIYQQTDCHDIEIRDAVVDGSPDKNIVVDGGKLKTAGPYLPGDVLKYQLIAKNDENSTDTLTRPILMDLLPPELEYVASSWQIERNPNNHNTPLFESIQNYNNSGRTLLRWTWDSDFLPADEVEISFEAVISTDVQAEQVISNTGYQTSNEVPNYGCDQVNGLDLFDLDDDGLTSDILCENNQATTFNIQSVASLVSEKLVRGQLDTAFSKFPNFGCTIPGGDVDYQIFVRNQGTVPMTNIVMIDILPFVGDKGVIDSQDRLSRWRPNLASPLQVPAGVTVYYSTVDNPCRSDEGIVDDGPPNCQSPNWTTTPPTQLADVQSFKLDFGSIVVAPGDELKVEWQMKAPVSTLDNVGNTSDTIAWNSFAFTANRVQPDGSIGNALLAAEPIKVGIRLETPKSGSYGNFVFHDDNQNGIQDAGELGIDNIQVSFYADNGDGIADPTTDTLVRTTITADGGLYLFPEVTEGNYFAVFQLPPAHDLSPSDQGADDALDSDGTGTTLNDQPVAIMPVTRIDASENDLSWDLGIYQNNTAAVGDYVWHDVNRDGLQNESPNYGLNSIEVYLFDVDNNLIATTTTANDAFGNPGYYRFDDLQPMGYYLEFDIPDAFSVTTTDQNGTESDAGDSDVVLQADTTKARTSIFTLVGNQYDPNWDAGLTLPTGIMSLGNFVWRDEDNNGNFNPATESGINDVIVNLYEDSNADGLFTPNVDTYLRTTNTRTNGGNMGYYQFDNLEEGDYIVQITTQNFDIGAPLHQFNSSTGNGSAPDPDDDVNFDDNGDPFEGYGVVSQAVTLLLDGEPDNDEDTDVNSNLTVDFGFFPPCGLSITQFEQNECQNNATEDNDTDDYFTVIVNADYANGSQYEIVLNAGQANEQLIATADYGTPTTIGNDQIFVADGQQSYQITIRDADNPSCFQTINTVATSHCSGCPQPLCVPISFKK